MKHSDFVEMQHLCNFAVTFVMKLINSYKILQFCLVSIFQKEYFQLEIFNSKKKGLSQCSRWRGK